MTPSEVWTSQCEVAREIMADSGAEDALQYLVGGKFLDFLQLAEDYPGWREEIPNFVAEIRNIFAGWQIAEYLTAAHSVGELVPAGGSELPSQLSRPRVNEPWSLQAGNRPLLELAARLLSDEG